MSSLLEKRNRALKPGGISLVLSFFQRLTVVTMGFGGSFPLFAATFAPCLLTAANLHIQVRSEPDDGAWGPTLEIVVSDELQPLSRLIAPESRPIEACWWVVTDLNQKAELIIGVGANGTEPGGARIFEWDGHTLRPIPLPALPTNAGTFRYVVSGDRLWAHPIAGAGRGLPAHPYRLEAGRWSAVEGDAEAQRPSP